MGVSSDELFQAAPQRRPERTHGMLHAMSPFIWAPIMYSSRLVLRGRVEPRTQHAVFGSMVLFALSHAGYIMFSDSTV